MASFNAKRTVRREPLAYRTLHVAVMGLAFLLFDGRSLAVGALASRFVPDTPFVAWAGVAIAAAGCAIAIWARAILGRNWSAGVTLKQDHQLIRMGPYRAVRHPIYSGLLLELTGTALSFGEWRCIVGLALAFAAWLIKSRGEEAFMIAQFGAQYIEYKRRVKALVPFIV